MEKVDFKEVLKKGKIKVIPKGHSGRVFILSYNRKKFILRKFRNIKERKLYGELSGKLSRFDILPRLYFSQGRRSLFEYIEGRDCEKTDADKVAEQIGTICAHLNKIKPIWPANRNKLFLKYANRLRTRKIITKKQTDELIKTYNGLVKKLKPKLVTDANDLNPENFRLRKGRVYFIDVEAALPFYRGQAIAKGFSRFFRKPGQRKKFLKGYNKVLSTKFLTEEYMTFLNIAFLTRSAFIGIYFYNEVRDWDIRELNSLMGWK